MRYKKIEKNNYEIYLLKTNKFKTIIISTVVINKYKKSDITKERLISNYLLNSNNNFKNEVLLSKEYMKLYDPRIGILDIFRDLHLKVFNLTFLNEKYTEKGMDKKTIDFYYDFIFNPNVENNEFDPSQLKIVKKSLESAYIRDEDNSSEIAYFNALSHITDDIPVKTDVRGNLNELNRINDNDLYIDYSNNLKTGKYIVFVTGDYNDQTIKNIQTILDKKCQKNTYELKSYFKVTKSKKYKEIIEDSKFNQSIVYLIYKIIRMNNKEREYVLPVLNNILGGNSSKLFNNVREKNSLAYYAYSDFNVSNNILFMYAGISFDNYEKCVNLMREQLEDIINGKITDEEIENAKESIYSSILKSEDTLAGVSNDLKAHILFDRHQNTVVKKNVEKVTKEEIVSLANKLNLDVIYTLKGDK